MTEVRPRRSVLYMPGSNARALEKAKTLPADGLILDLEDAVAPDAKAVAREALVAAVKGGGYGKREVVVRINALDTGMTLGDLAAVIPGRPDGIVLPKCAGAADVNKLARLFPEEFEALESSVRDQGGPRQWGAAGCARRQPLPGRPLQGADAQQPHPRVRAMEWQGRRDKGWAHPLPDAAQNEG